MGIQNMFCHIYLLVLFLSSKSHLSSASHAVYKGQSLTRSQTLVSASGVFELGFFRPGKSQNYYLGIWYKQIPAQTVVWVANREVPLLNTSAELRLSQDGNLLLLNHAKNFIWSTNISSSLLSSTEAVLLDTGNLVLRDGENSSTIFWESFDHPTDTWLPHSHFGKNKITGEIKVLTSWANPENPSPGMYTHRMDAMGGSRYYLIWNRSVKYWNSGIWNRRRFENLPGMTGHEIYFNFDYISNEREEYLNYFMKNGSILSRCVMDIAGQSKHYLWVNSSQEWLMISTYPADPCDVYSVCGYFGSCNSKEIPICRCLRGFEPRSLEEWKINDWSGGCVRKTPLAFGSKRHEDRFLMLSNIRWSSNYQILKLQSSVECESACRRNFSCSAYSYDAGCLIWSDGLRNLKELASGDVNGKYIFIRLAASELPKNKGNRKFLTLMSVISCLGIFSIMFVGIWKYWKMELTVPFWPIQSSLRAFKYRELQIATKNFTEKLGSGSFGSVFKGSVSSTSIAVKVLEGVRQGEKEFRAEVSILGTIQHVNLIRLRGFCTEGTKRLLVYDHMPNGSLDTLLFHEYRLLDWKMKYQIFVGIAKGLAYLHDSCRDCIIHCDIKPENILLDVDFCPKIADFGLAKLLGRDFSRVLTTMRGTRGYLAPEWISGLPITSKADVYSYGMMLFEILSGRRNLDCLNDGISGFFPISIARKLHNGEEILNLLDYQLGSDADAEQFKRASNVACWCIQDDEKNRPSMGHIIQCLEGVLDMSRPPIPLYLLNLVDNFACQESCEGENSEI